MTRLVALLTVVVLALPVAAGAATRGSVSHAKLVQLVGHRVKRHSSRARLRPSLHQVLHAAPARERRMDAPPAASAPASPPASPPASASPALSATERQLIDAMNSVRAHQGLRALTASAALSAAATVHSVEMLKRGYFEHESANGEDFSVRVSRYYPRNGARTWSIGENLAYGCPALSVDEAMDMWMHSAGHRANILHAAWTEVGISIVHVESASGEYEGDPTTVMTVDFGVRR